MAKVQSISIAEKSVISVIELLNLIESNSHSLSNEMKIETLSFLQNMVLYLFYLFLNFYFNTYSTFQT